MRFARTILLIAGGLGLVVLILAGGSAAGTVAAVAPAVTVTSGTAEGYVGVRVLMVGMPVLVGHRHRGIPFSWSRDRASWVLSARGSPAATVDPW